MTEDRTVRGHRRRGRHDSREMIALCLSDGPRTVAEIERQFIALPRSLGLFIELIDREAIERGDLRQELLADLEKMTDAGWVEPQQDRFALTPLGGTKAAEMLAGLRRAGTLAGRLVQPQTVSRISLGSHLILAALKFPAGLASGSVGLINDAADTLLDALASLLVYAGLRLRRERAVNVILVLLMLGTGGLALAQAVRRLLVPSEPQVDTFTFVAALLSAGVCLLLWFYQRSVGVRSGSMVLITQSVDSRNHVIVAVGVTAGLLASLLRFALLDALVGLAVALLILRSAIELVLETVRSWQDEGADLSRYRMGLLDRYEQFRKAQLRDWMLYLIEREGLTQAEVEARVDEALDFRDHPVLRGFGLGREAESGARAQPGLQELRQRGWVSGDERLSVTEAGRQQLRRLMRRSREERHRLTGDGARHQPGEHAS